MNWKSKYTDFYFIDIRCVFYINTLKSVLIKAEENYLLGLYRFLKETVRLFSDDTIPY